MSTPELNAVAEITTVKSVAKGGYLFHERDPSVGFTLCRPAPSNVHRVSARGNLKMQVDFRSVYAAILENWLKVPSEAVLANKYPLLECIA
ncbi:MAG: hypothetical protein L0Y58_11310 [Verrucomicrobia subdivision 3 bacterium]|nr:hypothetical protein [Limisphaerales bacterium]